MFECLKANVETKSKLEKLYDGLQREDKLTLMWTQISERIFLSFYITEYKFNKKNMSMK